MKKENTVIVTKGISFLGLLTIVFITLKLIGQITWSWFKVYEFFQSRRKKC